MHGGKLLVDGLDAHGVSHVFCVAGESYLPVLDAFLDYPDMQIVTCRHESGATFMAEAFGNLNAKPGVAFVTRGPGACNGTIGVHSAYQSSTPLILFVGLIGTQDRDKDAFQEFDLAQMYGSISKWAAVIDSADRIPEYVSRAFHIAQSGRPGPVVLGLPEDVLFPDVKPQEIKVIPREKRAVSFDAAALESILNGARKPVILAGGGGWSDEDCADLQRLSEQFDLPVAVSFRRHDIFDHRHANYIGELGTGANPALVARVRDADCLFVIGARLNEMSSQEYSIFTAQKIIHAYPDASVFGQSVIPDVSVEGDIGLALKAFLNLKVSGDWGEYRDSARADYEAWSDIEPVSNPNIDGADMNHVFHHLREMLPHDAVVVMGVGNFSGWCQRFLRYGRPGRLLGSIAGAMGYGVAASVGAAIARPDQKIVGIVGDGGFMMSASELATAVHHGGAPVLIVCNNGVFGTIKMHQEKHYAGRVSGTSLSNPDFVKLAESYGAFAVRVEHADDFPAAFEQALNAGKLALIEIKMDPRQITTRVVV